MTAPGADARCSAASLLSGVRFPHTAKLVLIRSSGLFTLVLVDPECVTTTTADAASKCKCLNRGKTDTEKKGGDEAKKIGE